MSNASVHQTVEVISIARMIHPRGHADIIKGHDRLLANHDEVLSEQLYQKCSDPRARQSVSSTIGKWRLSLIHERVEGGANRTYFSIVPGLKDALSEMPTKIRKESRGYIAICNTRAFQALPKDARDSATLSLLR